MTREHGLIVFIINVTSMSQPEPERELLLSASLDGELTPDEQVMLDGWLREDPSLARRRDELLATRDWVREGLSSSSAGGLGSGFADRVIEAAIARAGSEGLAADHPLVRLRDSQAADHAGTRRTRRTFWATAAALAASLLLMVAVRQLSNDQVGGEGAGAGIDQVAGGGERSGDGLPTTDLDRPRVPETKEAPDEAVARAGSERSKLPTGVDGSSPEEMGERVARGVPAASDGNSGLVGRPTSPAAGDDVMRLPGSELPADELRLRAVLFVSVELTDEGRRSVAIAEKLRQQGIRIGEKALLADQTIEDLERLQLVRPDESQASGALYYVQAPARQLDRFLIDVMDDSDSVEAFGLSILQDPAVLSRLQKLERVEQPADGIAASASYAHDLVFGDNEQWKLSRGDQVVMLQRGEEARQSLRMLANPDVPQQFESQLLLLVR